MKSSHIKVTAIDVFEQPFRLRMPFRFGVVTATHGRQTIARVRIETEEAAADGYAAEALGAKWFDKDLSLSDEQNYHQLRRSLEIASAAYFASAPSTPFSIFADNYQSHIDRCARVGLNSLIASFGPALLDRAILDALCRIRGIGFYEAMRRNLAGMTHHEIASDLTGFSWADFLRNLTPAESIDARHTVGLVDPITRADQENRIEDGLPETLEEVVATYGNRYFKLKVGGDEREDVARLKRIAAVLDRSSEPYWVTLDGNEQYDDVQGIKSLWHHIERDRALARFSSAVLYIEQPIRRSAALSASIGPLAELRPVIIDESDGELGTFPLARDLGYTGVSSKTCKGLYKSFINLARCKLWNSGRDPSRGFNYATRRFRSAGPCTRQLARDNPRGAKRAPFH
jgi:hypothetical protein